MSERIWLMLIRLLRIFVADFHAYSQIKLYGTFKPYEELSNEVWKDTEEYWEQLKEHKNE